MRNVCRWLLVAVLSGAEGLFAQSPSSADSLNKVIADLKIRMQVLEEQMAGFEDQTLIAGRDGAVYLPRRKLAKLRVDPVLEKPTGFESKLNVSGFMDGIFTSNPGSSHEGHAGFNQIELDLSHPLNERTSTALSICYADGSFGVGAATISYTLIKAGADDGHRNRRVTGWDVSAGQFDVPFGLDYQVYSSMARKAVTMPVAVAETHGGWNDIGMTTTVTSPYGTINGYVVKGFESRLWRGEGAVPEGLAEDDERWSVVAPSVSSGVRLNITLLPGLEGGGSLAHGWESRGAGAMSMTGLHVQDTWRSLSAKAEGIVLRKGDKASAQYSRGGYAEWMQRAGRVYLLERFDYVQRDNQATRRYYSAGLGVEAGAGIECRTEYRWSRTAGLRQLCVQIAGSF
ncbi:MAG TPA: hypothetical protein VGL38_12820 [bacterium]|jgi:hypothetical protein